MLIGGVQVKHGGVQMKHGGADCGNGGTGADLGEQHGGAVQA